MIVGLVDALISGEPRAFAVLGDYLRERQPGVVLPTGRQRLARRLVELLPADARWRLRAAAIEGLLQLGDGPLPEALRALPAARGDLEALARARAALDGPRAPRDGARRVHLLRALELAALPLDERGAREHVEALLIAARRDADQVLRQVAAALGEAGW